MKKAYLFCITFGLIAVLLAPIMKLMHIYGWKNVSITSHILLLAAMALLPFLQPEEGKAKPTQAVRVMTIGGALGGFFVLAALLMKDFHIHGFNYLLIAGLLIVLVVFASSALARLFVKKKIS